MKDLLEYIVKNLVSNPDAVSINEDSGNGEINLTLTVDTKDMGLIIGKGGQTIHAIRKILTVRAIAENVRVNLQLSEPEGGSLKGNHDEHTPGTEVDTSEMESKPTENENTSEVSEEKNKS